MSLKEALPELDATTIESAGDLILTVNDKSHPLPLKFRVSATVLKSASPYFSVLFDDTKFAEGRRLASEWTALRKQYGDANWADVPLAELPVAQTGNVGRIGKVKNFKGLLTDFFRAIHDKDLLVGAKTLPATNLANLAIVADRYDTLAALKRNLNRRNLISKNLMSGGKDETSRRRSSVKEQLEMGMFLPGESLVVGPDTSKDWSEERCRIRVLVGLLLGESTWVRETSALLARGSKLWIVDSDPPDIESTALWWDLPQGVEEELKARRRAILSALSSLPTFYMQSYASGTMQCRLGYGNSGQCDTYQLGEMTKFFARVGVLSLQSNMAGLEARDPFEGNIYQAIKLLKQVPPYQIDKDHGHCGLKIKMGPWLDMLELLIPFSGICLDCWKDQRSESAWYGAKGLLQVQANKYFAVTGLNRSKAHDWDNGKHWPCQALKDFFLCNNIDWER